MVAGRVGADDLRSHAEGGHRLTPVDHRHQRHPEAGGAVAGFDEQVAYRAGAPVGSPPPRKAGEQRCVGEHGGTVTGEEGEEGELVDERLATPDDLPVRRHTHVDHDA